VRRLQTVGLLLTVLLVVVLAGSAVLGVFGRDAADAPDPPAEPAMVETDLDAPRPRVEVLNGSGITGMARDATRTLRREGFDVVFYGNAPGSVRDTSVVIHRGGEADDARRVADALGIRRVDSQPDPGLFLEATVIVGRDWARTGEAAATGPPDAP
jgi:hypothetical protein